MPYLRSYMFFPGGGGGRGGRVMGLARGAAEAAVVGGEGGGGRIAVRPRPLAAGAGRMRRRGHRA
jgi:hypothetical protein